MKKIAVFGVGTALLFLVSMNLSADTNLLSNPGFETPASGVSPGTAVSFIGLCNSGGGSAAASWNVWSNGCANMSTTLVPSTATGGGSYMINVNTTGSNGGIVQDFLSSTTTSATASAWVYISSGCVGIGAGDDGNTGEDTQSCTTGQWLHLTAPNDSSPVTAFIVYDTSAGANFFVDNTSVAPTGAPTPEPATLTMLGMGMVGLSGLVRRRKKQIV